MYQPLLSQARELASQGEYQVVPVSRELFADEKTPLQVLRILKNVSSHCYLLESVEKNQNRGRYTFLGFDPTLCLSCSDGRITIDSGTAVTIETKHPGRYIQDIITKNKSPRFAYLPDFSGGLVGYFAYDYIKYAEPSLAFTGADKENFQDFDLMLFDKVIAFDHFRQKIILIANARLDQIETEYNRAVMELEKMAALIRRGEMQKSEKPQLLTPFEELFDKPAYCEMVTRAKQYIYEGDIFQVVLSNRLEAGFAGSLLDVYRVLRTTNPSPYMFYFSGSDVEIAGASPETLVKLNGSEVQTFPLAGTRARGRTPEEDDQLARELCHDEKELAEHNMLVDLGRNDLGRISSFGSVRVEQYQQVERFSHVMHLGSVVKGELRADKTAVDAIAAVLPAGTLSGAPKIRACEIIDELEQEKRGVYGGAIGYLAFTGAMDTCISIRIAYHKNGKVFVRSGAGIVADSVPELEYQECRNKAKAVLDAIALAERGIE